MASAIRALAGVEVGVGITGIAGPSGGSDAKPVGTVCIAVVAGEDHGAETPHLVRTFRFPGNRELVKTFAAFTAIDMVRRLLMGSGANADWVTK